MPARLQKNYYHEEAHYIYLGARGLKGGMRLKEKITYLEKLAETYITRAHDRQVNEIITQAAVVKALTYIEKGKSEYKYSWYVRSFWLDRAQQNQLKDTIREAVKKIEEKLAEEGRNFLRLQNKQTFS